LEDDERITAPQVNAGRCIGCWECLDACPQVKNTEYPVFARGDGVPEVVNPDSCIGCLSCLVACRAEALTVAGRGAGTTSWDERMRAKCRAIF
jgi:NAD-dependent dihydropyrimidine dehydrogenase PreA subunit